MKITQLQPVEDEEDLYESKIEMSAEELDYLVTFALNSLLTAGSIATNPDNSVNVLEESGLSKFFEQVMNEDEDDDANEDNSVVINEKIDIDKSKLN